MFKILKAIINYSQCISLCNKNFASIIRNLLSFSAQTLRFQVFFTISTNLQVSIDGFKVSIVSLREVSSKITKKQLGPTQGLRLEEVSIL